MNFTPFFQKYEDVLNMNMHRICALFCTIGNGSTESPRWYNFREISEDNILRIGSTQIEGLFFELQISASEARAIKCAFEAFWQAFKEYRTEFLKANYPTIRHNY